MTMKKKTIKLAATLWLLLSGGAGAAGFNDNGNGTVTDFATGLTWQQSDAHNSDAIDHAAAMLYCTGLSLAGGGWRLPEVKELSSIVDLRRVYPSIDLQYFAGAETSNYWSASSFASDKGNAWAVYFRDGGVTAYNEADTFFVRCVR
jgi:hypothetical protein